VRIWTNEPVIDRSPKEEIREKAKFMQGKLKNKIGWKEGKLELIFWICLVISLFGSLTMNH